MGTDTVLELDPADYADLDPIAYPRLAELVELALRDGRRIRVELVA